MEALITFFGIVIGFGTAYFMANTQMIFEAGQYKAYEAYSLHATAAAVYAVAAYVFIFAAN